MLLANVTVEKDYSGLWMACNLTSCLAHVWALDSMIVREGSNPFVAAAEIRLLFLLFDGGLHPATDFCAVDATCHLYYLCRLSSVVHDLVRSRVDCSPSIIQ